MTGVIYDPLGQPTVSAGSDCRLILKFWDVRTYRWTDGRKFSVKIVIITVVGLVDQISNNAEYKISILGP